MKIAICDDEKVARECVVTFLEEYLHDRKVEIEYEVFEDYISFQDKIEEFNIFLMDYETPGINGLEFAHKIREQYGENKAIIFITSYESVVYESFKVRALRYIVKPLKKEDLYEALDAYMRTNVVTKRITVKSNGMTESIDSSDIYYIWSERKDIHICLKDSEVVCRETIDSLTETLEKFGFFRVHRSFLVNLMHVNRYDSENVELTNGSAAPMSLRKYQEFKKAYIKFTAEQF